MAAPPAKKNQNMAGAPQAKFFQSPMTSAPQAKNFGF